MSDRRRDRDADQPEQLTLGFDDVDPDDEPERSQGEPEAGPPLARPVEAAQEFGQLGLAGVPEGRERVRTVVPSRVWELLLADTGTRARYESKIWRPDGDGCAWWLGAISDTGHGKMRISRKLRSPAQVVTAHVYGYQLQHGLLRPRPGEDLVIAHRCDETSCQQAGHWELVPRSVNGADYLARRDRATGPLADVRGPHGRAAAIRTAILSALAAGHDVDQVTQAIADAQAAGLSTSPGLF
jgi:hypothetical protein